MGRRGNISFRTLGFACIAGVLVGGPRANASLISFDPDGAANNANAALSVSSFEYLPGNLLLRNGIKNITEGSSYTTDAFFHAKVGYLLDANSQRLTINNFIGSSTSSAAFELTAVAQFTATITRTGTASYGITLSSGPVNTFNIYYDNDSSKRATDLTGEGFADGTPILTGSVGDIPVSSFQFTGLGGRLDQFDADNFSGITANALLGSLNLAINIQSENSGFFLDTSPLASMVFQSNLRTPFNAVDPSHNFHALDGHNTLVQPTFTSNNDGTPDSDLQVQIASNTTLFVFGQSVPEPASVAMFLTGLSLTVLRRRRAVFASHIRQTDKSND